MAGTSTVSFPTPAHWPLQRYVTPEEFREWEAVARRDYGFAAVVSGPLVRSSYGAEAAATAAGADVAGVL